MVFFFFLDGVFDEREIKLNDEVKRTGRQEGCKARLWWYRLEPGAGYDSRCRRLDVSRVLSLVVEGASAKAIFVCCVFFCVDRPEVVVYTLLELEFDYLRKMDNYL